MNCLEIFLTIARNESNATLAKVTSGNNNQVFEEDYKKQTWQNGP